MLPILRVVGSCMIIAMMAQFTWSLGIPGAEIPVTGQSLAVLIVAFFLTPGESIIAIGIYLILGVIGLPVFADGNSGWNILTGKSGGYLYGFILAALFVSWRSSKGDRNSLTKILIVTLIGTLIILLIGAAHLAAQIGVSNSIKYGILPFWKGALIKIILGSLIVWFINKYFGKRILKDVYSD